ncbi:MAG: diaminopimelate dehydrogenase [Thermovirgaceae bacterium]|nr:diaminopimelate dehydrogenase [Thermovirgaceae bacterium]
MGKIRVAVTGYGNVAKEAVNAVNSAPDMEMAGIVIRDPDKIKKTEKESGLPVVLDPSMLEKINVTVLAIASRAVPQVAPAYLEQGICTVDCYDIHGDSMMGLRHSLNASALKGSSAALVGAGWDPGTDSLFRGIFEIITPRGITYTDFGPGVSMGHTVAVKNIPGVKNAVSITLPAGQGKHRRAVYVEVAEGHSIDAIRRAIFEDNYFRHDETTIEAVDDVEQLIDLGHSVHVERKGAAASSCNQRMFLEMSIMNPCATAQVMVSAARGIVRQKPGCYTMLEIPVADCLPGDRETILKRLV